MVTVKGSINLSAVSLIREHVSNSKCNHVFDLVTSSRIWTLGTDDLSTAMAWIGHLRESVFGNILHEGWLYKRGGKVQSWKKRFFQLSDTKILRYYEDQECNKFKGSVSLSSVIKIQRGGDTVTPSSSSSSDASQGFGKIINMTTPSRVWWLSCPTEQAQNDWMEVLNHGRQVLNYDEKATLFMGLTSAYASSSTQHAKCTVHKCVCIERLKFVMAIYSQWIRIQQRQQLKLQPSVSSEFEHSELTEMSDSRGLFEVDRDHGDDVDDGYESDNAVPVSHPRSATLHQYHSNHTSKRATMNGLQKVSSLPDKMPSLRQKAHTVDSVMVKPKRAHKKRGMYEIINGDLKDYSNLHLLHDYHHIVEQHTKDEAQFDALHNYLKQNEADESNADDDNKQEDNDRDHSIPFCVLRTFRHKAVYANYKHNHEEREYLFFNHTDPLEIATQTILDKIYCHLYYVDMWRLNSIELQQLQWHTTATHNNDTATDDEYAVECDDEILSETQQLMRQKREPLVQAQTRSRFRLQLRSDRFMVGTELQSTAHAQQSNANAESHCFGDNYFFYWSGDPNQQSGSAPPCAITAKYRDFKREMLNNAWQCLSLAQWNCVHAKSNLLAETLDVQSIGAFSAWKMSPKIHTISQRYEIAENASMTLGHIQSMILYCNFHELSQAFRRTFIGSGQDALQKHAEFAHFARNLVECVSVFGVPLETKKHHSMCLYHAIEDEQLILHRLSCQYVAPVSMSKAFEVVWSYSSSNAERSGLLLKLRQEKNFSAFVMDCALFSDFPMEYEHIAIANDEPMRIDSIIDCQLFANLKHYIHAMFTLTSLLSAQLPMYAVDDKNVLRASHKLVRFQLEKNTKQIVNERLRLPSYIEQLFDAKCINITSIDIDCRQILEKRKKDNDENNGCFANFAPLLVSQSDSDSDDVDNRHCLNLEVLMILFPNVTAIAVQYCHFLHLESTLDKLLGCVSTLSGVHTKASFRIEFNDPFHSAQTSPMQTIVRKYSKPFQEIHFEIFSLDECIVCKANTNHNRPKSAKSPKINGKRLHLHPTEAAPETAAMDHDASPNNDEDCLIM
eukprot:CAMPEP_0202729226 /NCGR_PEP_ID=MMETSP1385-20130828/186024_1 /ASSEMBLY_ACC=CAM_ASM_000861 /TAXON_ID=933848 /ORGANISM="Elphidium margaritaceum" /LENGTH=1069 /DNA_ID=CAMNT_0049395483 /DNA_START=92 /DNA_END=3301 /DNA_ORIENTATION=+